MSTFSGTVTSREDLEEVMQNWPMWLVKPWAYDWGWFTSECEISCEKCAFEKLESGEVESIDYFSFDEPMHSGESCSHCCEYVVEPWCSNCADVAKPGNRIMIEAGGESALCRKCYLTGLLTSEEVHNWDRSYS